MADQEKTSLPVTLLIPALSWMAGICLATLLNLSFIWLVGISLLSLTAAFIFKFRLPFVILLFTVAGFLRLSLAIETKPTPLQQTLAQRQSITQPCTGRVLRVLYGSRDAYIVQLTGIGKQKVNDKAFMYTKSELLPGDSFQALAKLSLRLPDPVLDKTSFYQMHRYRSTRIVLSPVYRLEKSKAGSRISLERLRHHILQSIDKKMGEAAPFAKALLLNDRTSDREWIEKLIQGGLLHLIAISGLHVLFFYFVFVTLFNLLLPRRVSELIFLVLMLFYAGLCQWSAPVMRAILMILLYLVGRWLQRPVAPLQIMLLSLFIITLIDPVQLFSVGLQLSYVCVIVIAFIVPKWHPDLSKKPYWKRKTTGAGIFVAKMVITSALVSLILLPLSLFYFQKGSLNSIIGNLAGIPLMGVLLPLTFVLLLLPSNWAVFHWLKASFDLLYFAFQYVVLWSSKLPFFVDTVVVPLTLLLAIYLFTAAVVTRFWKGYRLKRLSYAMMLTALLLLAFSVTHKTRNFTLTVFNAGLGDCILVELPQGQNLMVDTGPVNYDSKTKTARSWFGSRTPLWQKQHRINRIDLLVLTHLDSDHSGGLADVFQNMKVKNLLISRQAAQTPQWHKLEQSSLLKEAKIHVLNDTLSFNLGGAHISVLHPNRDFISQDDNDNSIVLRLDYKDFSALLTGDISSDVETMLVNSIPQKLDTDFLKAPHHGSRYSNSAAFIRAVSPEEVCITASRFNRFLFPNPETLERYRSYGVEPCITGNGSVVVSVK